MTIKRFLESGRVGALGLTAIFAFGMAVENTIEHKYRNKECLKCTQVEVINAND